MFKALGRSEIFDLQNFFNDSMAGLTNQPYMAYSTRDTPLVRVVKIIPDIIICRPCQTNVTSMSHRHGQTTHWRRPMHIAQPRAPYSTPFQQPLPSLNLPPRSLLTAIIFISSCFVRNS